jgi:hypothetical protein
VLKNQRPQKILAHLLPLLVLAWISASCTHAIPVPDWSSVPWGPFNLIDPPGISNPVFTAADITDRNTEFVADPFLFQDQDGWYLFFEVFDRDTFQGDIGLATSMDGLQWNYDSIVLNEEFHLSYPDVFEYQGTYYMLPETTSSTSQVIATDFPINGSIYPPHQR